MKTLGRSSPVHLLGAGLLATALLAACGGDDSDETTEPAATEDAVSDQTDDGNDGTADVDPCDLTEPDVVAEVMGGTVDNETGGPAGSCDYEIQGGAAGGVSIFYYGTASEWDGIRGGYEDNRGPLTEVSGVGDEAFNPDVGDIEVIVLAGDVAFAVTVGGSTSDYTPEAPAKLEELARRIAEDVS